MLKGKAVLDRGGHPANQPGLLLFGNSPRPSGSQVAVRVPISPQAQILLLSFPATCLFVPPGASSLTVKSQGRGAGPRGAADQERRLPNRKGKVRALAHCKAGCRKERAGGAACCQG